MGPALAETAQAAVAVALINPLPVMAVIVLLFSSRAATSAPAFAIGWLAGLIVMLGLLLVVIAQGGAMGSGREPSTLASAVQAGLGLLLFVFAIRRWRGRPKPGETPKTPGWVVSLEKASPLSALGLGVLLSGFNPKNLAFTIAAAVAIAEAQLAAGARLISVVFYALLASAGVAGPIVWRAIARDHADKTLAGWRIWLTVNYNTIMTVVFILFGVKLLAQGLGGLIG